MGYGQGFEFYSKKSGMSLKLGGASFGTKSDSRGIEIYFIGSFFRNRQGLPRWLSGKEPICQCRRPKGQGFDPLKEGMATHSSILAWEIGWTEEPSGLQSIGLQRVRHV